MFLLFDASFTGCHRSSCQPSYVCYNHSFETPPVSIVYQMIWWSMKRGDATIILAIATNFVPKSDWLGRVYISVYITYYRRFSQAIWSSPVWLLLSLNYLSVLFILYRGHEVLVCPMIGSMIILIFWNLHEILKLNTFECAFYNSQIVITSVSVYGTENGWEDYFVHFGNNWPTIVYPHHRRPNLIRSSSECNGPVQVLVVDALH